MHTCTQAQAGSWCRAVETISGEVVRAGETGRRVMLVWGDPDPWAHCGLVVSMGDTLRGPGRVSGRGTPALVRSLR